nr:hypothetical protein CFP56_11440 [Quercus suber]
MPLKILHTCPHLHTNPPDSKQKPGSPRKRLLEEIHLGALARRARGGADVVGHAAGAADADGHGADLGELLLAQQGGDVGFAGEHLDAGRGRRDLLGAAGPGDEEQDAQDVAAALHGEDLRHPRPDPLKVLGRLDDPDQHDAARRAGAGRVRGDQVAHVRDLVRDADARGEQQHGTVRAEALVAVGPFDERRGAEFAAGALLGFAEEGVGEAGAAADDERHGGFLGGEGVVAGGREHLFRRRVGFLGAPGEREGVAGPEPDRRHVQVDVLAGVEVPRSGDVQGESERVTGQRLDVGFGQTATGVTVDEADQAQAPFQHPEDDGGNDEFLLLHPLGMQPHAGHGCGGEEDVDEDREESKAADGAGEDEFAAHGVADRGPALACSHAGDLPGSPESAMGDGFEDHDTSDPPMDEVVSIKRDAQSRDERVVTAGQEE